MNITVEGGFVYVQVPHSFTPEMRTIPGASWLQSRRCWKLPYSLQTMAALGGGDAFADLERMAERQDQRRHRVDPIPGYGHLYPFQAAGVRFLAGGKGVLMADEMGTGKTVQTLTAIELEQAYPALVVCPNSLKHNWAREVRQWTNARPVVIEGTAAQRRTLIREAFEDSQLDTTRTPVVVIINYESLVKHTKLASFGNKVLTEEQKREKELNDIQWSSVVVDEAHKIKSPKAQQTRAVWGVADGARYRFALTGTPIANNPDDLWSIMRFVAPTEYPSRQRFRDRYCLVRPGWHGGLENLGLREESRPEFDRLIGPRLIRRTKLEVLPELPEKILTTRHIPMTSEQTKVYKQMVDLMMAQLETGVLIATDPLTLVGKLRYIACATPVLVDDQVSSLTNPSNKLKEVIDILDETQDSLVVYGQSRKLIEFFERELSPDYGVSVVTGAVTSAQRQVAIDAFQAGETQVFLATTGAGAEGLTLTRANRMVIAMEDWSNVANKQAHDRIHRIGQDRGVEIITLVSEGTIEEAVSAATDRKENLLQQLVQDEEMLMKAVFGAR